MILNVPFELRLTLNFIYIVSSSIIIIFPFYSNFIVKRPNKPEQTRQGVKIPFVKGRVVCATEMGSLTNLPSAAAIIGGSIIAVEYATVLAELGVVNDFLKIMTLMLIAFFALYECESKSVSEIETSIDNMCTLPIFTEV